MEKLQKDKFVSTVMQQLNVPDIDGSVPENPFDLGWADGYNDNVPENPFEPNTENYKEYEQGYEQGSRDC